MKLKIQFLLIAFLMGATLTLSAQNSTAKKTPPTPQEMAQKETDRMTKNLSLTSDQQTKIQAINLKYAQERSDVMAKMKGQTLTEEQKKQMKEDAKASMTKQEAEFKTVLNTDQYNKYLENKKNAMKKIESKVEKKE